MSKRATILAMLVALSSICAKAPAGTTNTPLTFFLVSKQRIEGEYFNRFPFHGLGYISSKPDLVVEHLKAVSSIPETSIPAWKEDRESGTVTKATIVRAERFLFTLDREDAVRLKRLADTVERERKLVLVLLGDKAIHSRPTELIVEKARG